MRPIDALREWRRVTRAGGIVAARDADYDAMTWYPAAPLLDRWLMLYRAIARRNGGEPDAGRHLLAWAHEAGFDEVEATASAWCFATPEDRAWWATTWAERVERVRPRRPAAVPQGWPTRAELDAIGAAWRAWADEPDGWFSVLHAEIVCRVP